MNRGTVAVPLVQSLAEVVERIVQGDGSELRELEAFVGKQIALKSGLKRGAVADSPGFDVRRIRLGSREVVTEVDSAIKWFSHRVRESGSDVFNVSLRCQSDSLLIVVEWNRLWRRVRLA